MPPLYKLKHTHWVPALWLLALLLPLGIQAQQTENPVFQKELDQKLAPTLRHAAAGSSLASYSVQVKDTADFRAWLQNKQWKAQLTEVAGYRNIMVVSGISRSQLLLLLSSPSVIYVDRASRQAQEELELKDADFVANNIYAAQARFPDLTGEGMTVSVKENPFNPQDPDLQGRVLGAVGNEHSVHATTMATLIAGAGNTGPAGKGVTWKSMLAHSDFADLYPDDSELLLSQGISVQNHSYGVGVENYYGLESQAYDRQAFQNPQLLHVFSSGNSGDKSDTTGTYANLPGIANLTGQFKTSKNTISVGALEPNGQVGIRSSRGPAYDGRIKPELVAHGVGGTSEAAAVVSGIALLVQQAYKEKHGNLPPASLVKAALINSAEDTGRPGPDFESGFGNADALGAIRIVENNHFVLGAVAQGETKTYQLTIPAGTHLVKATIAWHDPEAEPNAEKALLHDLDLTLRHKATGKTWQPWVLSSHPHPDSLRLPARRGTDRLNNVEQITLLTPSAGVYTLTVSGHQVAKGPQEFSLVYEFEQGMEWLYPAAGSSLVAGQANRLAWQGVAQAGLGRLEYRLSGSEAWHLIDPNVALDGPGYTWQTPDTMAIAQLRLTAGNKVAVSEEFVVARPLSLQVGFNCDEQVMFQWPALPNVQQYQLYYLGDTHLQPLLTTTDTLAVFDKRALQSDFVAISPIVQGLNAQNSPSVALESADAGCYVTSFLARQLVMDTVKLDLAIGTLYQLASISLERKGKTSGFTTIQTLNPVSQLSHVLTDSQPENGRNIYRVKVSTTDGKTFYSQQEEVIYASENFVQVYPNPVTAGQPFYIAVASDSAQIQLYDQMGRLVLETTEAGVLKEVRTNGLKRGLYIVKVKSESGTYLTGKVLVL
ncbi:S8 family serine peptidase [Pontibacter sp. JH31]|uniref:S8 family serine peptidase n=1 Tax=Pontibacter aquaedesilientis TaxID=2766980 RepID=A0ABR7XE15_9BACT|nr:S8 family serine peptidase [Pontibacter aquaedesilientis]MBD1396532.1 S8 family serine peptidase [Pontibacter aquaedesilientis]